MAMAYKVEQPVAHYAFYLMRGNHTRYTHTWMDPIR
jgi:hypothetical protein